MTTQIFGNPDAKSVLIQAVDRQSLAATAEYAGTLSDPASADFCLKAVIVDDWFRDLSPWTAAAVFGNNAFGDGAAGTLDQILDLCTDTGRKYYIGGYSLSGLFALWSAYQTDIFAGVAAASPSVWFPGFTDYMKDHDIRCGAVYLSLGDAESRTRNKVMATVDDCIRSAYDTLSQQGRRCILEWNRGNHFTDVGMRCARAFAWIMNNA